MRTESKAVIKSVENELLIHVYDENRQTSKDFRCARNLLLENMSYFKTYLKEGEKAEEIDI